MEDEQQGHRQLWSERAEDEKGRGQNEIIKDSHSAVRAHQKERGRVKEAVFRIKDVFVKVGSVEGEPRRRRKDKGSERRILAQKDHAARGKVGGRKST